MIICVLVGLPGSGKSSFARDIVLDSHRKIVFSYDAVERQGEGYKSFRRKAGDRLKSLIQDELQSDDLVVFVDDIMIYRSMRYEIYTLARSLNLNGFCIIYLNTDIECCVLRNAQRGSTDVTEDMIRDQYKRQEPPGQTKSMMDTIFLEIRDNNYQLEDVLALFQQAEQKGIPSAPLPNPPATQSDVHKIDLLLRKHIGSCIANESNAAAKRILAEELNSRRQDLLQDIRNGTLTFEEPFQEVFYYLTSSCVMNRPFNSN